MQLTSLSLALTRAGFLQFSPASLFANGEQGVWYEPSLTNGTCFQDAAGTTPVTAVEQPVGLILDKSKGLVLGQEYVTNAADREFTSDTGFWAKEGNSSISGGVVNINNAPGTSAIYKFNFPNAPGGYVEISFDLVITAGAVSVRYGGAYSQIFTTSGKKTVRMYRPAVGTFAITSAGAVTALGTIDNISVRELPGNHAFQTTSTSRPVLSARYNLLTNTEQFDDAAWVKNSVTVTPNAATAPDGAATAEKIIPNPATAQFYVIQNAQFVSGVSYTISTALKKAGYRYAQLTLPSAVAGINQYANFDLEAGSITFQTGGTASIVDLGQGWYRCSWTAAVSTTLVAGVGAVVIINDGNAPRVPSFTGDGTSGIYIWGASLVPANQASLPYQRVNTSTDYDADPAKFPPYLRFDGVDDWLVTPTITPGTDKAQVFAGVRKVAVATTQMIVELSADLNANNGSIYLLVSNVTDRGYAFSSKGTVSPTPAFYSPTTPSTETAVITAIGSISEDYMALRRNGVDATPSTSDQGTGNYLAYPLYIGRRAGTSFPFNGHLYSLIVRFGANPPAGTIASTENWVAGKTGITL